MQSPGTHGRVCMLCTLKSLFVGIWQASQDLFPMLASFVVLVGLTIFA